MSLQVLKDRSQIRQARDTLEQRNLSALPGPIEGTFKHLVTRSRLARPLVIGDYVKSWDLLATVEFLEEKLERGAPILDIGCYASEVLVSLDRAGFTKLTGADLNPRISEMPLQDRIQYVQGDFMNLPLADESFSAITSISVIEHGYDPARLFKEMSRLLKPGGYFIASFDYWRDKIDTTGTKFFGMDWLIFSEPDVRALLAEAEKHGLIPIGDLNYQGGDKAIAHGGYEYTFAWLGLQKRP